MLMNSLPTFFHQTPFFRLLLPFIAGIIFGFQLSIPGIPSFLICTILLICLCVLLRYRKKMLFYGIFLNLFLIFAGICTVSVHRFTPAEQTEQGLWLAIVDEPPVEKENSMKMTIRVQADLSDTLKTSRDEKVMAYFRKDDLSQKIKQGDLLVIDAVLKPVTNSGNPYEFDYCGYLNNQHIGRSVFVESGKYRYLAEYAQGPLLNLSNRIRNHLLAVYKHAGLSGNELAVASALVLGYKADLDDVLRGAYSASGAMHVLAVSGLHVGVIYLVFGAFLKLIPFRGRANLLRTLILLTILWLYALITGMSPSVMRASTMFSIIIVGEAFRRKAYIYNSIAASAFILLFINPTNLFDVGFQLSYVAVIAIVFFHSRIYGLFTFKGWLPDQIWSLTCVSIAAQIGTVPLSLFYFHQFPVYFLLANLIVIPGASVIIYGSLFLFVVSPMIPVMTAVGWMLDKFLYLFNAGIFFIEKLPGSVIWGIRFQSWEILVLYSLLAFISTWVLTTRKSWLFVSIALCLLWITGSVAIDYRDLSRQQLIVYNTPGTGLLQFANGRDNTIWYESRNSSFNAPAATEYQRIAMKLNEARCIMPDSVLFRSDERLEQSNIYVNGNFIQFAGKRLAVFTRNFPPEDTGTSPITTDVVVLSQNVNTRISQILKAYRPETVVIDASNTLTRIDRWEKECVEAGTKCHRTDRDGAFVLKR